MSWRDRHPSGVQASEHTPELDRVGNMKGGVVNPAAPALRGALRVGVEDQQRSLVDAERHGSGAPLKHVSAHDITPEELRVLERANLQAQRFERRGFSEGRSAHGISARLDSH
jgi:hypothetical protein